MLKNSKFKLENVEKTRAKEASQLTEIIEIFKKEV